MNVPLVVLVLPIVVLLTTCPYSMAHDGNLLGDLPLVARRDHNKSCRAHSKTYFPNGVFTDAELRKGAIVVHVLVLLYVTTALCIVVESYLLGALQAASRMCRLSSSRSYSTWVAAGFSFPLFFVVCFSVFSAPSDVGTGAVLGTCAFNILFVLPLCGLLTQRKLKLEWFPIVRDAIFIFICLLVQCIITSEEAVMTTPLVILLVAYGIYAIVIMFNSRLQTTCEMCCSSDGEAKDEAKPLVRSKVISFHLRRPNRNRQQDSTPSGSNPVRKSSLKTTSKHTSILENDDHMYSQVNFTVPSQTDAMQSHNQCKTTPHADDIRLAGKTVDDVKEADCSRAVQPTAADAEEIDAQPTNTVQSDRPTPTSTDDTHFDRGYYSDQSPADATVTVGQFTSDGNMSDMSMHSYLLRRKVVYKKPTKRKGPFFFTPNLESYTFGVRSQFDAPSANLSKIAWVIALPILVLYRTTIPDCRQPKQRIYYPWTIVMCLAWIALLSYMILWMVTVISYTLHIPESLVGLFIIAVCLGSPGLGSVLMQCHRGNLGLLHAKAFSSTVFNLSIVSGLPWLIERCRDYIVLVEDLSLFHLSIAVFSMTFVAIMIIRGSNWSLSSRTCTVIALMYCTTLLCFFTLEFSPLTQSRVELC